MRQFVRVALRARLYQDRCILGGNAGYAPAHVLLMGYRLKMVWIDAPSYAAEMIQEQAIGYRTN